MRPLLIVYLDLGIGGVQRKIVDLVNYLSKYKPSLPIYIILRNRSRFNLGTEIINNKVKILNFQDFSNIKLPLFFPFYVLIMFLKFNPSSVLTFLDHASLSAIFAKKLIFWKKIKLVISEDHYTPTIVSGLRFSKVRHYLIRILYPFADIIFTCSMANKKALIDYYKIKPNKIKIIKNWTTFRKDKQNNKSKKYDLVYVGRIEKTKNLKTLLYSIPKINKRLRRNIKVLIVGEGKEKGNLIQISRNLDIYKDTTFLDTRHNIQKYLNESKILVCTSLTKAEGLPVAILEAMALEIPVISKNFAGINEFFEDNIDCLFFNSQNDFTEKCTTLLKNKKLQSKLGKNSRKNIIKNHSIKNMLPYIKELEL
ncbi:MAG: glycosyltransferase [Patescibacteria group bacterium]